MDDMKIKNHSSSKKHKKNKKHKTKQKKEARSRSSDSEPSETEMEWVEATESTKESPKAESPKVESPKAKHEDWMNTESFVHTLTRQELMSGSSRQRKKEEQDQQKAREESIQKSRELNPHWKNDGTGLPQEENDVESLRLPSTSVGDGGYAYLKKAYIRIQEQAQEERRSMEDVAVERWGSLSKLESMIEEAEARMKHHTKNKYKSSYHRDDRSPPKSYKKPHHRATSPSPEKSFRFEKPKDYDRNRKKVGKFSSSDLRRSRSSFSDIEDKDSHLIHPSKSREYKVKENYEETDGRFASPPRSQIPSWKKVKKSTEDGDRESSAQKEDKFETDKRFASPPRSHVPSWKKVKKGAEDDDKRRKSPSPEEPTPQKSSRTSLVINSKDDLNKLASKYLKADMMGDKALAAKLKADLEEARRAFEEGERRFSGEASDAKPREKERVLLTKADSSGLQRPIQSAREDSGFERRSGHKKTVNKYFDDGSKYSLKQMFEREKLTTVEDNLEMFMEVAAEAKESTDDNETSGITRKASHKMSHGVQEEKDIQKAISQHQKMNSALEKCEYCMDQPNMKRHLLVTVQNLVYLSVPNYESLTKGHCLIVPKRHVPSFLNLDEDEWDEVEEVKSLLRNVFRMQKKSVLFLETSFNFKWCPHAFLECIPVPEEDGDMAPFYFKKAIQESEEEWAHNIKLVDLTKKGLRKSVPKNLPYFCVSFDPAVHAGYAHVIENERSFPKNFGKEVVGGMLDIDYNHLYKNKKADAVKKSNEALELSKMMKAVN